MSTPKQRVRVPAGSSRTVDSFQNLTARLGVGSDNLLSQSRYALNPVTRNRIQLEFAYRGSWIVRAACDIIAEDMTREGFLFEKGVAPEDSDKMQSDMTELGVLGSLADAIKWARLYGGAVAYMMIDGHKAEDPLDAEKLTQDQFKGLLVFDRYQLIPDTANPVKELGPDFGKAEFYQVTAYATGMAGQKIHYSRLIRFEGDPLPYWQRMAEMGWGASVLEALWDRLLAFDSTTVGASQMVYRAHLRVVMIEGLRAAIANAGKAMEGVQAQLDYMRAAQTLEGMTVIDAKDKFESQTFTFTGLSDMILQFGQQLSGALQIPLVRLFGQSPAGLNSTGESDLRTYYDGISTKQRRWKREFSRLIRVMHISSLGRSPSDDFDFKFAPLYELSEKEKGEIAVSTTAAVREAYEADLIPAHVAMQELRQSSDVTGIFTNITEKDIEEAKLNPPAPPGLEGVAPGDDVGPDGLPLPGGDEPPAPGVPPVPAAAPEPIRKVA